MGHLSQRGQITENQAKEKKKKTFIINQRERSEPWEYQFHPCGALAVFIFFGK